jgi:outer membrane protein assembly factor BamB
MDARLVWGTYRLDWSATPYFKYVRGIMRGTHLYSLLGGIACLVVTGFCRADEWPQWRGPNRDGVWKEQGIVDHFSADRLEPKWRTPISSGYNGPTVAEGRVFVMDRVVEPEQKERIHCLHWETGQPLWVHEYPCVYKISYTAGPRAAVTVEDGRAYALGAMGHLHCLDAATGEVLWSHDLNTEYAIRMPIWGIAAAPLIEGDLVIVQIGGSDGACVVAFDKRSGEERWKSLDDEASYSAPIMVEQAGRRVAVCWTGASVAGLDPKTGEALWRYPFPPKEMVISISTPVVDHGRVFVTSFYDGSLLLKLDQSKLAASELWRRRGQDERNTDALHSIISTPVFECGYIYGVDSYGELRCLDAKTGDRLWEDTTATPRDRWSNIHFVRHGDETWLFNERGELIIAKLSPSGYEEIDRAKLIDPTEDQLRQRGGVCWSHPAFAYKHVFARNDREIVCASLAVE